MFSVAGSIGLTNLLLYILLGTELDITDDPQGLLNELTNMNN